MYLAAAILFVISFFSAFDYSPVASMIFFSGGTLLMAARLAKRFWTQTRIRLIELLFMTTLSGGILGISIQWLLSNRWRTDMIPPYIVIEFCVIALWMLGGVSNAIIVAERLRLDGTFQRLGLIVVYLLLPVIVVLGPVLLIAICIQRDTVWLLSLFEFLGTAIAAICFFVYAWRLRIKAKLAGSSLVALKPPSEKHIAKRGHSLLGSRLP
jgi:hypothetical protein